MRNFIISTFLTKYSWGDQMEEDEMSGTNSTHGKKNRNVYTIQSDNVCECGIGSCDSGLGPVAGVCEHDNEFYGSIRSCEFLDQLLKGSPPQSQMLRKLI